MYADSYFSIGTTHKICQDYALAGTIYDRQFAAISDGCSSSEHTDFGARFLCLATQEALKRSEASVNQNSILSLACMMLGNALPWECLDATLLFTYTTPELIVALASGDGVIAARHRDGSIHTNEIEFGANAPAYLSYQLDPNRFKVYSEGKMPNGDVLEGCGVRETRQRIYDKNCAVVVDREDGFSSEKINSEPRSFWYIMCYSRTDYDMVAVMSDGVHTFQRKNKLGQQENVPLQEVLGQLMKFKNVKGEFVTRRCKRFLGKFCPQNGWAHYDDFSMAAVYVE